MLTIKLILVKLHQLMFMDGAQILGVQENGMNQAHLQVLLLQQEVGH